MYAQDQALLDALADAIVIVDDLGHIEQVNKQAEALFAYQTSELVGRPIGVLFPEHGTRARVHDAFLAHLGEGGTRETLSLNARRSDETPVPVDIVLNRLETPDGVRVIATVRDTTHQRRAEKAARKSSRLLEACFKHMLTQIAILDPAFNFIRVTEAYARATGYQVSDFPGRNHFELFPSDAKAIFERVVESREPFQTFARPFVHPSHPEWGVTYWDWTLVPILDEGNHDVELLLFALEDVTERVRTTEELRLKERQLTEAKQFEVVGQLAAGIAHDFNNVLTCVLFTLDLLKPKPGTDPTTERVTADAVDVVHRAKTLTHQLLSFGRKQLLQPELIELNSAVNERRTALQQLLSDDTELRIVSGESEGSFVNVDPGQLDRILLNLTANAADAMPGGGKLTVVTTHLDLDATSASEHQGLAPGSYVMLSFQDDGVGMDDATRERVFEPFFTTKTDPLGSGLGLSSVHGIVKQSGGEIFVHSELGAGTTFKILFPRVGAPDSPGDRHPTIDAAGRSATTRTTSPTILVVEDDAIIRKLIVMGLRQCGYTVHDVASGEAAWSFLAEHADDVGAVLSDVMMLELDGVTLANRIGRTYPDLPVVLMSGYAETDKAGLSPPRPFIPKPFTPPDIAAALARVLDEN